MNSGGVMKERKIPMRTCVVTNEKLPKRELIRIVRGPDGVVTVDKTGKKNGRGVYLKLDKEVIEKARKSKILDKRLETEVTSEVYEDLNKLIK